MKLKQPYGWFAAGREVRQAMEVLSDGAFKLYMHLCLYADRETGSLAASRSALARAMRRAPDSIHGYLEEMRQKGVARLRGTECSDGVHVEICDTYWPYQTARSGEMTECLVEFAGQVRGLLAARRCVAISFSPADEKLAKKLFEQGTPLEQVRRAILLACARKCVAAGNGQVAGPISSLRYFVGSIEEVGKLEMGSDYWRYLEFRLNALEEQWLEKHKRNGASEEMMETK